MSAQSYTPSLMTPALGDSLREAGYRLPEVWPFPARVEPEMNSKHGWTVRVIGGGREEGVTVYTAPDGTRFTPVVNGARTVLVGLSKVTGPQRLRVLPGTHRPMWVIKDTPKGEIPEHLKAFLLKKGEKLVKGAGRKVAQMAEEAEAFAVEPVAEQHVGRSKASKMNYSTMTDAQLVEWAEARKDWWQARAYQIEKQGVDGFRARVRAALAGAGKITPKAEAKPRAARKSARKQGRQRKAA